MHRKGWRRALLALAAAGCATNPATGRREISLVSESQEIAMGEEAQRATRASIGVYPDANLQSYASTLGRRLAAASERPGLPWSFEVIDDAEVNAFAAPGGKIFITRGILAFLDSEAELAGVLGHEIGHITARHTAQQITRQQLFGIGLIAGSLLSTRIAEMAGGIQTGLQVLFLSYSREAEEQADELGFRYMRRGNYDVREMPKVFAALARVGQLSGGGRLPTWQSTHPDPVDREEDAVRRAAAVPGDSLRSALVNRDGFLRMLDGIMFGANPRQGYFEGARFLHPDLRFRLDFPPGWQTQNRADAVLAGSPGNDAVVALSLGGQETPDALFQKFAAQEGIQMGPTQRPTVNGLAAVSAEFRAQDAQGNQLAGRVLYLRYGATSYQLLGYGVAERWAAHRSAVEQSLGSFAQLSDPAALAKQPNHLVLVRVPRAMTIEEFHRSYPSAVSLAVIAAINGVAAGATLPAGFTAKRVR